MEIVKQNESFSLKDTNETYEMTGNVSHDINGAINLHINVNKVGGEYVGDCSYNKYGEGSSVNFSVNCSEDNRDDLMKYADTVVDSVLEYFKTV